MKKLPNAQDLLEKSNPVFGQKTTFQQAYSQVEALDLVVTATPMGFGKDATYHYSLLNPPGNFCPCPNHNCKGGGFDIGWFLHDLISSNKESGESESCGCIGREPMGRNSSRSCYYMFKATATIRYKK